VADPLLDIVGESIKLSVAPVFLLTAVAGMISVLTQRVARVIDRSRFLQMELHNQDKVPLAPAMLRIYNQELHKLAQRATVVNTSMVLLVVCAIFIALTILELFLSETASGRIVTSKTLMYTFIGGVVCFVFALIGLLIEVLLASYTVRMKPISKQNLQI
jgi:uncharacterized membrane protein